MAQKKTQGQHQGQQKNQPQGQQPGSQQSGQQDGNQRQTQNPDRDPAEGPPQYAPSHDDQSGRQQSPGSQQRDDTSRHDKREPRASRDFHRQGNHQGSGGGISNRDIDQEMDEQEELPDRDDR